ncbi:MAG: hypothetical protein JKY65_22815 [Planctomycetes bacterium]|nr:hypothetical protein [Planctomycetota bacterium]
MTAESSAADGEKGSPSNRPNPYATPRSRVDDGSSPTRGSEPEGSYGIGLACGGVFGLWGLVGCHLMGKSETKRDSVHGFLGRLGIAAVVVLGVVLFA